MGINKHFRREIAIRIGEIQDNHCKGCEDPNYLSKKSSIAVSYCNTQCEHGKKLIKYGKMLLGEGKIEVKPVINYPEKLTKETMIELKEKGVTDKEIKDHYGMNNANFYKLKNDWGLVNTTTTRKTTLQNDSSNVIDTTQYNSLKKELQEAKSYLEQLQAENEQLKNEIDSYEDDLKNQKDPLEKLELLKSFNDLTVKYQSIKEALKAHL